MVRTRRVDPVPCDWHGSDPPQWATAISAWGDTLVCAGNALALARRVAALPIGLVYYGRYPQIAEFLAGQSWVRECVQVIPANQEEFWQVLNRSAAGAPRCDWLPLLLGGSGIAPETVCPTHFNMRLTIPQPVNLWRPRLPARAWSEARALLSAHPPDTYLLHPWSFQSAQLKHHWPHWLMLVRWLLETTPRTYLLTGVGFHARQFGKHPRLIDLVSRIPRMDTLLALASRSAGVISTCNSLACWSATVGKRAFVLGNSGMLDPANLFVRWIKQPCVTWCEHSETAAAVRKRMATWLSLP